MKQYNCPNPYVWAGTTAWLPFAELVEVSFEGIPFTMKGVHSKSSVMVIPFRKVGETFQVGILTEQRPLFYKGSLSAFPAGKVEDGQTPEEAAILETLQEAGLKVLRLLFIGKDIPFLHLVDEEVFIFAALVDENKDSQSLEVGEWITGFGWHDWQVFVSAIKAQQRYGCDLMADAPMLGVSLMAANKLMAIGFEPQEFEL